MDLATLSSVDDVLSDLLVDKLHLWFITHKMDGEYTPVDVPEQVVMDIIQRDVVVNRRPGDALQRLLELDVIKTRFSGYDVLKAFKSHARRYLGMYLPSAGYEISQTDRYTAVTKKSEACVIARRDISPGHEIVACSGSISILTPEEDLNLTRDFSVIRTSRRGTNIFLGPARFVNHDCDPNCAFVSRGAHTVYLKATKQIVPNEELTVYYDDNYFGENNCDCLCATCERLEKGAFNKSQDTEATDSLASEDDTANDERSPSQNLRKRLTKVVNYFPHLNKKTVRKGGSSTPEVPSSPSSKTKISRLSLLSVERERERDTSLLSSSSSRPESASKSHPSVLQPSPSSSSSNSPQPVQTTASSTSMSMSTPRSPLVSPVASPSPPMSTSPSPIPRSVTARSALEVHTSSSPTLTPSPKTVDNEMEKQQTDLSVALADLHIESHESELDRVNQNSAVLHGQGHLEKSRFSYNRMSIDFLCNDQSEITSSSLYPTENDITSRLKENCSSVGSKEQPSKEDSSTDQSSTENASMDPPLTENSSMDPPLTENSSMDQLLTDQFSEEQTTSTLSTATQSTTAEGSDQDSNDVAVNANECPTCGDVIPPHQRSPTSDCRRCHRHLMIYCIPWPSRDHKLVAAELDRRDALLNIGKTPAESAASTMTGEVANEYFAGYALPQLPQASRVLPFDPTIHAESAMGKSSGQRVVSASPVQLAPDGKGLLILDQNGSPSLFPLVHHYGDQRLAQTDEQQHPFHIAPYVVFVEPIDGSDIVEKPWAVAISVPRHQMDSSMPQIDLDDDGQPDPNVAVVRFLDSGDYGIHHLQCLHLFVPGQGVFRDFFAVHGRNLCNNVGVQRAMAFVYNFDFPYELRWQHLDFAGLRPLSEVGTAILHHSGWDITRIQRLRQRQAHIEAYFQNIYLEALLRGKESETFPSPPGTVTPFPLIFDGSSEQRPEESVTKRLSPAEKAERKNRARREKRAADALAAALAKAEAAARAEADGNDRTHSSKQGRSKVRSTNDSNLQREGSRSESPSRSRPLNDQLERRDEVASDSRKRSGSRTAIPHDQDIGSRRWITSKTTSNKAAATTTSMDGTLSDQAAPLTGPRTRTRARADSSPTEPDMEALSTQSNPSASSTAKGELKTFANKRVRQSAPSKLSTPIDPSERPSKRSKLSSDLPVHTELPAESSTSETTGVALGRRRKEKEQSYFTPRSMPAEVSGAAMIEVTPTYRFKALLNIPMPFNDDFYLEDSLQWR